MSANKDIKLSICIPTFNRSQDLLETLDSIKHCGRNYLEFIEICISDNGSADSTSDLVHDWMSTNSNITARYWVNTQNIGVDGNCHKVLMKSHGSYAWLLCDDDQISERIFDNFFYETNTNSPSFIFLNYIIEDSQGHKTSSVCAVSDNAYFEGADFLSASRLAFCFGSSCIFRKDLLVSRASTLVDHIGTNWFHLYTAIEVMSSYKDTLALIIGNSGLVQRTRGGKESRAEKRRTDGEGSDFYLSAHSNILSSYFSLRAHFNGHDREFMDRWFARENIKQLITYKLYSNFKLSDLSLILNIIRKYNLGAKYLLPLLMTALTPSIVFRLLRKIKYALV